MNATTAREILTFSKSHEGYDAPIPEDDAALVAEAEQLVRQAAIAWNRNNARGPEVAGVLRLADETFDGTGDFSGDEAPQAAQPPEVPATPAEAPEAPQEAPQAPETPGEEFLTRQEPWMEYDGDAVEVVINALDVAKVEDEAANILHHVWAYENANKGRQRILDHLATIAVEFNGGTPPPADTAEEQPQEPQAPEPPANGHAPDSPPPEKGIDYSDLIREVEAEISRDRLHVPQPPTDEAPVFPYDVSRVSDKELRDLHHAFSAYAYFADTRVLRHEAIATRARQQADDIVRELLLTVAQYDDKNHERRMTFITAEVESSPHVVALRSIQRRHEIFAEAARRERDGYHKLVEGLSRQESMRQNEWLRAQK